MLEPKYIHAHNDLLLNISLAGGQSLKWIYQKYLFLKPITLFTGVWVTIYVTSKNVLCGLAAN